MIKRLKDLFFIAKEIKALLVFLGVSGVTFVEFKEFFCTICTHIKYNGLF